MIGRAAAFQARPIEHFLPRKFLREIMLEKNLCSLQPSPVRRDGAWANTVPMLRRAAPAPQFADGAESSLDSGEVVPFEDVPERRLSSNVTGLGHAAGNMAYQGSVRSARTFATRLVA
jgi:hypothetical protein